MTGKKKTEKQNETTKSLQRTTTDLLLKLLNNSTNLLRGSCQRLSNCSHNTLQWRYHDNHIWKTYPQDGAIKYALKRVNVNIYHISATEHSF